MADNPPAPPANAGFKLKLKLGGGNSSTTVSPAIPSTAAVPKPASPPEPSISNLPGPSAASTSTSLPAGPPAASNSASAASEEAAPVQASNDSIVSSEAHNDAEEGDYEPDEMEEYGGEYATSKKAAAKLQRARKTSTPAANSNLAAASSSSYAMAADSSDLQTTMSSASPLNNASPGPSVSKSHDAAKYETSIGSIVLPASSTSSAGTSRKRKPGEGGGTGLGRGWRKGLKGYQRGDLNSPGPGAARGDVIPGTSGSSAGSSRKRKAHTAAAAAVAAGDESTLDRNLDAEDFVPNMAPPGALATSEKWANGLPGGNEQSRLTASMANAVNRQFPVGPPPKVGTLFLLSWHTRTRF